FRPIIRRDMGGDYLMLVLEVNAAEMPKSKHEQNDLYDILILISICGFSFSQAETTSFRYSNKSNW
ncbi:hypothetical protein, partial [Vibrio splendidus]|uniref:hypothetical protein n=1 Tax=Vibrio splendidus TaxID=29497 RepID=UPI001A7E1123